MVLYWLIQMSRILNSLNRMVQWTTWRCLDFASKLDGKRNSSILVVTHFTALFCAIQACVMDTLNWHSMSLHYCLSLQPHHIAYHRPPTLPMRRQQALCTSHHFRLSYHTQHSRPLCLITSSVMCAITLRNSFLAVLILLAPTARWPTAAKSANQQHPAIHL